MRPQQQNRRMRGRNNNNNNNSSNSSNNNSGNNNRKGPNPLTRNYESNGPDVKIRGSAQQIAEKYTTLARDAHTSGDRVMSENYLQHAEHYNRIIAAAQAQMPIQNTQQNRDDFDDDGDENRDDFDSGNNNDVADAPAPVVNQGSGPQPEIEGTPAEVALNSEGGRDRDRSGRHRDRRPNGGYGQNGERGDHGSRAEQGEQRGDQGAPRGEQNRRDELQAENAPQVEPAPAPRFEDLSPAGLAARAELNEAAQAELKGNTAEADAAPRRPRRPRRPRVAEGADAAVEAASSEPVVSES